MNSVISTVGNVSEGLSIRIWKTAKLRRSLLRELLWNLIMQNMVKKEGKCPLISNEFT